MMFWVGPSIWVNSRHHQAVREPAPGFMASALASDGLIEALEKPDYPFFLAVQWHPEGAWSHDECSLKLFQALVRAAEEYQASRREPTG